MESQKTVADGGIMSSDPPQKIVTISADNDPMGDCEEQKRFSP